MNRFLSHLRYVTDIASDSRSHLPKRICDRLNRFNPAGHHDSTLVIYVADADGHNAAFGVIGRDDNVHTGLSE
jgi:hypothetical protein